ncbi:MAG TPA: hypothetical protein VHR18_04385 [Solirubrobacterales bacterium]|jgi:hypothetical protein|nr:hypothetical protein [Solirubrobacterales bacterium]
MSRLTDIVRRPASKRDREKPPASAASKPSPIPEGPNHKELVAQRDRLLEKFTVMQADLGGAFYEMAIRDHLRIDVLTRKAAELQRVDAELTAAERTLDIERSDAAGHCPNCGSPFMHGVRFCAQCGGSLSASIEAAPVAAVPFPPASLTAPGTTAAAPTPAPPTPPPEAPTQEVPRTPRAETPS